jgi:hypothetical protein
MGIKEKPRPQVSADVKSLLGEIGKERENIDRSEGDVVASHVRIAHHLAKLRDLVKGHWERQIEELGFSPRVARRYLRIARDWPDENGLRESDFLKRLPADLLKLEWLCRLSMEQLKGLLKTLDCKKARRTEIIAAVHEALGNVPAAKAEPDLEEWVRRLLRRLSHAVEQLGEEFPASQDRARARELVEHGLHQVLQPLAASPDHS